MALYITYILLIIITVYTVNTCITIWKRTQSLILIVPIAAMYFWTLYGVWFWIPMKLAGQKNFYEEIMFSTSIDWYYCQSILYYSFFIGTFCFYIKRVAKREFIKNKKSTGSRKGQILHTIDTLINNNLYYGIILVSLLGFVYLWKDDIVTAIITNVSAYSVSRFDSATGAKESIAQFLGNLFIYLSVPLLFARDAQFRKIVLYSCYAVFFGLNFALGNRAILIMGMAIGVMLFCEMYGIRRFLKVRYLALGLLLFAGIHFISFVRGSNINDILEGNFEFNLFEIFSSASTSSEKDAAQISMYGVLKYDTPFTYGSSVLFLFSTLIPSFLGLYRPPRIYEHYVSHTIPGGVDLGVTIHHATAWYLNFGLLGIVLGALMWGKIQGFLFVRRSRFVYLYGSVLFSAVSINMIRDGGIECYKGALLMSTIIPMLIIKWSLKRRENQKKVVKQK